MDFTQNGRIKVFEKSSSVRSGGRFAIRSRSSCGHLSCAVVGGGPAATITATRRRREHSSQLSIGGVDVADEDGGGFFQADNAPLVQRRCGGTLTRTLGHAGYLVLAGHERDVPLIVEH